MHLTNKTIFSTLDSSYTLLINSLSGAVDRVPNELALKLKLLQNKESLIMDHSLDSCIIDYFIQRGYIFNTFEDEDKYILDLFNKSKQISSQKPVKFVICPTYSCNLRCVYCYEGDLGLRNKNIMTDMQLDALLFAVDKIREAHSVSHWLFELFGGEPLSLETKSIVQKIFERLDDRFEAFAIVTNGTNILEFQELIIRYNNILDFIQVTLDGPKPIHDRRRKYNNGDGSFERIVQGIDFLLKEGIQVDLRVNVDNQNIGYLPEFITFMERKNWPSYQNFNCDIAPVTFHTSLVNSEEILTEDKIVLKIIDMFPDMAHFRKVINFGMFRVLNYVTSILEPSREHVIVMPSFHYCEATNLECYVFGPDNNIYACPDSIVNPKYAIGSYYPEFILDVHTQAYWKRNILNISKCKECEVATFCGGGCALVPLEAGSTEPACNGAKDALLEYLNRQKQIIA